MKVYILWYWNGEIYEDSYSNIDSIYLSKENANKACKQKNKQAKKDYNSQKTWSLYEYSIQEKEIADCKCDMMKELKNWIKTNNEFYPECLPFRAVLHKIDELEKGE